MTHFPIVRLTIASTALLGAWLLIATQPGATVSAFAEEIEEPHRSPIALAISADGTRLLTANQTSGTVSLVDPAAGMVLDEIDTGDRPAGVALSEDKSLGVVTHWYGHDLAILTLDEDRLALVGRVEVGPEPRGVVVSPDGGTAYVAVGASDEVVRVDLEAREVTGRLKVGREPRGLSLSTDGDRLLVGNARSGDLTWIATDRWEVERTLTLEPDSTNLRQLAIGPDGQGYVAYMRNRGFATTANNIDLGWVLGQRVGRVDLAGDAVFSTLSLDPKGVAAADVHGLALDGSGSVLAVSSGGTHEVFLIRLDGRQLPWRRNGSRDLMTPDLVADAERFRRVEVGGRPTELAFSPDGRMLYVANYLADSIQVLDVADGRLVRSIDLGGPAELSMERQGEILFHDAMRSSNQWYSCNTCHSDGHTNGEDYDTLNDGWQDLSTAHTQSRKKAPTLRRVAQTGPWTWHGWQTNLEDAMIESFTKSMQGDAPTSEEVTALIAYLATLDYPRNPNLNPDGSMSEAAARGEVVFRSAKAGCATCHGGPEFTDGKIHDVGLNERRDVYRGHNPPSLVGLYDKGPYLHDGRAETLREVLTDEHSPELLVGSEGLTDQELDDLIAYLESL